MEFFTLARTATVGRALFSCRAAQQFRIGTKSMRNVGAALTGFRYNSNYSIDLKGIYPPIVTPFKADESICYEKLKENFDAWNQFSFRGYLVQGSNGEFAYLTAAERLEMVQRARKFIPTDRLLLVGSGCESTNATIKMTKQMADAGADAAVVVTPSFYKGRMTSSALQKYYVQVADASPIPIILYNVPANTGLELTVETILPLVSHPNIVGIKDSAGNVSKLGLLASKTQDIDFQIIAGSASFLIPSYTIGCVGGICALANVLGEEVCKLHSLFEKSDLQSAKVLQVSLIEPNLTVTQKLGVAGLKLAMDYKGLYGGPVRRPLLPLTPEERKVLLEAFKSFGLKQA